MKIYTMTATFGKLEHQTLTLKPGLNVISAPNEWGKSTWCAFLVAMLYGIDTRERTKQNYLADKERYAPWSGSPMSGRIDLCWNGRDITIERATRGRTIFGAFQAYETATGLPIKELTATNCGETLLGVEKSVFTRAGFIRLSDMPVSEDDALRRRLNALVTTGDESSAGDALEQKLRDLKNRCRYNRSGLLPQAEAQRDAIADKLRRQQQLQAQAQEYGQALAAVTEEIQSLENHRAALAYAAAQKDSARIAQAQAVRDACAVQLQQLEMQCQGLPSMEKTEAALQQLHNMPRLPEPPLQDLPFRGLDAAQTQVMLHADMARYKALTGAGKMIPYLLIAGIACIGAVVLAFTLPRFMPWNWLLPAAGLLPLVCRLLLRIGQRRECHALEEKYGSSDPALWEKAAQAHAENQTAYAHAMDAYNRARVAYDSQTAGTTPQRWEQIHRLLTQLEAAQKEYRQACTHADSLCAMAKDAPPPDFPDTLTCTAEETSVSLGKALAKREHLQLRYGQCIGQAEALGQEDSLQQQLTAVETRIAHLEDIYTAATIALQTLSQASDNLQRKFAPRISQRAQALFARLTGNRYDRLLLGEDLSVSAGALGEDTLRSGLWRSDGTADQLYLALRLAVAEELTPTAPLVLDDALVRFDDTRLANAMAILTDVALNKQVILFSCQSREENYL